MNNLKNFEEVSRTRWVEMLEENAVRARQKANFLKYLVSDEYVDFSFLFVTQSYNFIREILQEYSYMLKKLNYKISFHSNEIFLEDGRRMIQIIKWYKGAELKNYGVSKTRGRIKIPPFEMYISPSTKEENKVKSKDIKKEQYEDNIKNAFYRSSDIYNKLTDKFCKICEMEVKASKDIGLFYELISLQESALSMMSLLRRVVETKGIDLKEEK